MRDLSPPLQVLSLYGVLLGSAGVGALGSGEWPGLRSLDLGLTGLDSAAARRLAAGRWPELRELAVYQSWSTLPSEDDLLAASILAGEGAWPRVSRVRALSPIVGLLEVWDEVWDPTAICPRILGAFNARWPTVAS